MRRSLPGATLALITVMLLAAPASAGGWASVVLDDANVPPTAGEPTTIGFTLWQHADTRASGVEPTITFRRDGSSEAVVVGARDEGPKGHYVAQVTLPTAGSWSMTMTSDLLIETKFLPIAVAAPPAAAAPAAPAKPAVVPTAAPVGAPVAASSTPAVEPEPAPGSPSIVVLAMVVALVVILGLGLVVGRRTGIIHRRRRTAEGG